MADDEETFAKIKEVFDTYDVEKECCIQAFEIVNALGSLQLKATQTDIDDILAELEISDATITLDQFQDIISKHEEKCQKDELVKAFRCFDKEKKGYITYEQLEGILKPMLGKEITKEELREIVEQADSDNSGTIEIEEFVDFLSQ